MEKNRNRPLEGQTLTLLLILTDIKVLFWVISIMFDFVVPNQQKQYILVEHSCMILRFNAMHIINILNTRFWFECQKPLNGDITLSQK